jgi:hypothetical protein
MAAVDKAVAAKVTNLRNRARHRDERMRDIRHVRAGNLDELAPGLFGDSWPKPIVANFIDVAAQDLAAVLAPLPSLACASGAMQTDVDRRRAEKKNKAGYHYWHESRLATQMFSGADRWGSYGFLPFYVEPDFDRQTPIIQVDDPFGCYYENDRWGRTRIYIRTWKAPIGQLCTMWPEHAPLIRRDKRGRESEDDTEVEVIRYCDDNQTILYIPDRDELVLSHYANPLDECPAVVIERPGVDSEQRGQWDGVVWIQLAQHRLAMLALDAAYNAVMAPIAMPKDAQELPIGPHAVIRTDNPQGVRRVPIEIPQSAFAWQAQLSQEARVGAGYPEARLGTPQGSVVTGRGVEALMGGFDSQIKRFQEIARHGLSKATSLAFQMDEKLFGHVERTINGTMHGESYQIKWRPKSDINGNTSCDVTYGFAAGLSPNAAAVLLLQLRGDGDISRNTMRKQLPFDIDVDAEQRELDVQEAEDALKQGLFAFAQALGPMAQAGMDPQVPIIALASVIDARQKGTPLAEAVKTAFTPPEPPPGAPVPGGEAPPGAGGITPGGGGSLPGVDAAGLMPGVAPGQAGMPPGGLPTVQDIIAGIRPNGSAALSASVRRRLPAGGA